MATAAAAAALLLVSGCSEEPGEPSARAAAPTTACKGVARASWQRLANRIDAPIYCPGWLPDPLTPDIDGQWNNIDSVDPDRSYLESFVWQEKGIELHVNLRGYPGRTTIPRCQDITVTGRVPRKRRLPCFSDAGPSQKRAPGIVATVYTVNQDADQWHVLYAWRAFGNLYTLSEHVAPPLTYRKVVQNLDRMLRSLVVLRPT